MKSGVYLITNKVNGKVYVGSSKDVARRIKRHKYLLTNGRHDNEHLLNAWNNYGEENFKFEVLEHCPEDARIEREDAYMKQYNSLDREFGYNKELASLTVLSEATKKKLSKAHMGKKLSKEHLENLRKIAKERIGTKMPKESIEASRQKRTGQKRTEEQRKRMSEATKKAMENLSDEKKARMTAHTQTEEHKEKMRQANLGRKQSEEEIAKRAAKHRGRKNTEETKKKMSESAKGRKMSDDTKKKLSELNKGKVISEETRQKMREAHKRRREEKQNNEPM